jgi:hypothetical protein
MVESDRGKLRIGDEIASAPRLPEEIEDLVRYSGPPSSTTTWLGSSHARTQSSESSSDIGEVNTLRLVARRTNPKRTTCGTPTGSDPLMQSSHHDEAAAWCGEALS